MMLAPAVTSPLQLGCNCRECPLNQNTPVMPELRPGALATVIGEAPGGEEERTGAPFVGRSGKELDKTLQRCGFSRYNVSLDNVVLCRPPGNEMKRLLAKLTKINKARKAVGDEPIKTPLECCAPHLEATLTQTHALIILGGTALTVLRKHWSVELKPGKPETKGGGEAGMMRLRGFPLYLVFRGRRIPMVASVHPAYVLRKRRWTATLRADISKGFRHAQGLLQWRDPEVTFDPTPEELTNILARMGGSIVGVDIETDDKEPLTAGLRCVGIATERFGVAAGFDSVEGRPPWQWKCHPEVSRRIIADFLQRDDILITGNNINVFDRQALDRFEMPLPKDFSKVFDVTVADHVVHPEFPHGLDFLMSRYTDSSKHKDTKHDAWKSDEELHDYCVKDCAGSAVLTPHHARLLHDLGLGKVYLSDVKNLQRLAVGMHRVGMWIDDDERRRHEVRLSLALAEARSRAYAAMGYEINLDSTDQVRNAFFTDMGFHLPATSVETDGGEPSVNKDAIYELVQRGLPRRARLFMEALLDYRRCKKLLGTYVTNLLVWLDGRVHSTYNPNSNISGRVNSSGPNVFNVPGTKVDPDSLRSMFAAAPGNVYVGADLAQAHLRIIAVRAGIAPWLDIFNADPAKAKGNPMLDLHCVDAGMFFDKSPRAIQKFERDFAKTMIYLLVYDGQPPTAHQLMQRVRNPKTGERPYADLPLLDVQRMRDRLLKSIPELERWWLEEVDGWRRKRKVFDFVLGRMNTLLDLESQQDVSKIVNFPILATEAALMAKIIGQVIDAVGWSFETTGARGLGGPGIVHYNYDSLTLEVAERNGPMAKGLLEEIMTTTLSYGGRSVLIPAEGAIGSRWSEV